MNCPALRMDDTAGLAAALDAVDCRSGQAIGGAFDHLFGAQGALLPALTIMLTLYVAIFAIGLLTGRSRIGVSALTPRVLTIGLALTFATSWAAYQNVVWTLAVGAPDELASMIVGTHGSATRLFAQGLDHIFAAIADAAQQTPPATAPTGTTGGAPGGMPAAAQGALSGSTLLWLSAILLLLGTVGTLITAKIAMAGLLALGPVFIVLAMFRGTWGLFEGWLKALLLLMLVPLFVVLIGGGALAMIVPVIRAAIGAEGEEAQRAAIILFLAASVYTALLIMVVKITATIVSGWRLPFAEARSREQGGVPAAALAMMTSQASLLSTGQPGARPAVDDRVRAIAGLLPPPAAGEIAASSASSTFRIVSTGEGASAAPAPHSSHRPQGLGSRFRAPVRAIARDRLT